MDFPFAFLIVFCSLRHSHSQKKELFFFSPIGGKNTPNRMKIKREKFSPYTVRGKCFENFQVKSWNFPIFTSNFLNF